jgi:hypothetical protein
MKRLDLINLIDSIESSNGQIILKEIVSLLQDKEHALIRALKSKPVELGLSQETQNVLTYTRGQLDILEVLIKQTLNPNVLKQALDTEIVPASY